MDTVAEFEAFIELLGVSELTDEEWEKYKELKGWNNANSK